jgi:hypothetical protein
LILTSILTFFNLNLNLNFKTGTEEKELELIKLKQEFELVNEVKDGLETSLKAAMDEAER